MSHNPFLDLGFPREEAIPLHIRSQLAATLERHIEHKGWSQTQAARELKVPQPTISKIVNGNIDKLSIEFLVKLTVRAGIPVHVSSGRAPGATRSHRPSRSLAAGPRALRS
jgi:predicted XRE-type DNA-binding protein